MAKIIIMKLKSSLLLNTLRITHAPVICITHICIYKLILSDILDSSYVTLPVGVCIMHDCGVTELRIVAFC